jgi:apolipoprotein N-acyltransferase
MLSLSFAPFDLWFLAYAALAPWTLALVGWRGSEARLASGCGKQKPAPPAARGRLKNFVAGPMFLAWAAGLVFWLANLYWLWWITLLGYFLTSIYLSAYWLAGAAMLRLTVRRGWPAWLALSVFWTALEYVRAYVISGFPWFYLAHSQYTRAPLIQVADLTGQYGVSFLVAMAGGAIVDLVRGLTGGAGRRAVLRAAWGAVAFAAAMAATLAYGYWRLGEPATAPGPVLGIVQEAFPISLSGRPASAQKIHDDHLAAAEALIPWKPDLLLIPESMLIAGLNRQFLTLDMSSLSRECLAAMASRVFPPEDRKAHDDLYLVEELYIPFLREQAAKVGDLSRRMDCPILAGGVAIQPNPQAPMGPYDHWHRYNAALWFDASSATGDANRPIWECAPYYYSKTHLVPFSEYLPFRRSIPPLFRFLRMFVPDVMEQLLPGSRTGGYTLTRPAPAGPPRSWRLATPICYEGVFDYVCRSLVWQDGRKSADMLVNLSNDGWFVWQLPGGGFHRSAEYPQHLAQYCFRAVESRVPVVRAVNTGISASIDSCGRIRAVLRRGGHSVMVRGTMVLDGGEGLGKDGVQHGPLVLVDARTSVYSRVGDVFAMITLILAACLALAAELQRRLSRRGLEGAAS